MTLDEWNEYFQRNYKMVRRVAVWCTGDSNLAEDIVQEMWIRLTRHHPKIDRDKPDGYVFTALHHACSDEIRRRRRQQALTDDPVDPETTSEEESADLAECANEVGSALRQLTKKQRQALHLHLTLPRAEANQAMNGYDAALNRARANMSAQRSEQLPSGTDLRDLTISLGLPCILQLLEAEPQQKDETNLEESGDEQ